MRLVLVRRLPDITSPVTLGKLLVERDGRFIFTCDTLEDTDRLLESGKTAKVPGATAIPRGTYPIAITQSARFQRALPLLVGVPQFEGVRIHPGNTSADTSGCILVGRYTGGDFITDSRKTFAELFSLLSDTPTTITIV